MKNGIAKCITGVVIMILIGNCFTMKARADNVSVSTFNDLMTVLSYAQDGDVIDITGNITISVQTDIGYQDKTITLKRTNATSGLKFNYSSVGSSITNIIFDGTSVIAANAMVDVDESITMNNVTFKDCKNRDSSGGAVVIWGGSAVFNDCTFDGCGATDGAGVAMYSGSSIEFNRCSMNNGTVTGKGGAVFIGSSTINMNFTECTMTGNSAGKGGFIYSSSITNLEDCLIYGNSATESGSDVYIDEYGKITFNNTLDELKVLYEANSLVLDGVYDESSNSQLDIASQIAGTKNIQFKYSTVTPTPEPTPSITPTPSPVSEQAIGSNGSTPTNPSITYNQTYNPTINNNVPATTKTPDEMVTATATPTSAQVTKVQTSGGTDSGAKAIESDGMLKLQEGENTITININLGTGQVEQVKTEIASAIIPDKAVAAAPEQKEVQYIQKPVNVLDIVEVIVIIMIGLFLVKDKLKVKFQGSYKKKE